MTPRREDEAFSWEGDDDPTLRVDSAREPDDESDQPDQEPVALPVGFTAVGRGADDVGRVEPDGTVVMAGDPKPVGSAALVAIGILGGVYLLFTLGWILGGMRLEGTAQFLVSAGAYLVAVVLAALAAPVWFATTYLLTRSSRTWVRITWLIIGALLLIPWPFIMTGTVGR